MVMAVATGKKPFQAMVNVMPGVVVGAGGQGSAREDYT
jgi:hypothetical protein